MHVSVCIVAYKNPADTVRCLAALARSQHTDFDVVICENGGPDAFAQLAEVTPLALSGGQRVTSVLAPGNLGYAGGVNTCLKAASDSDAWWVLNPDTEPYPEAMGRLVARLAQGDCEAVGSTLHLPSGKVQSHGGVWKPWLARSISIAHGSKLDDKPDPAEIERVQNYLNGASMMIGRRFLETVGPMREDYFLYCEEVEWCLRAGRAGMRLGFAPDALVLHYLGSTTGNVASVAEKARAPVYLNERNKILLTRDVYPDRVIPVALATLAVSIVRYAKRRAWRQLGYAFDGWSAGVRGERGPLKPETKVAAA